VINPAFPKTKEQDFPHTKWQKANCESFDLFHKKQT